MGDWFWFGFFTAATILVVWVCWDWNPFGD